MQNDTTRELKCHIQTAVSRSQHRSRAVLHFEFTKCALHEMNSDMCLLSVQQNRAQKKWKKKSSFPSQNAKNVLISRKHSLEPIS